MSNYENIINEHFFEVISNFGNNIKSPEHDFLYHYTPQTTLIKILDEKKLHLSHVSYLNDPDEIKFGLKVILKILKNSIKNNSYSINKISEILETNDNFEKIIFQKLFFVFSLSVEPDLLSQWRAYADGGNGISIGFVRQNLINSVARHLNNNNNIPFFIPISYYSNKCISSQVIIPKFEKHINLFFKYFDDIVVENKVNKSIEYNESFKQIFTVYLYLLASFIKNDFYKEEKEWRLIFTTGRGNKNISVKEKDNNKSLKIIYELPIKEIINNFRERDSYLIEKIIIGPKHSNNIGVKIAIEQLLYKYTDDFGKVSFSGGYLN